MLRCTQCAHEFSEMTLEQCTLCGGIVLAEYEPEYIKQGQTQLKEKMGISGFAPVLPKLKPESWVSLGECDTPYLKSVRLSAQMGFSSLCFKDESRNPTGSFKDRAIALCVSAARELNKKTLVVASSGNGAASVAAYGAKAGIETVVTIPENTPEGKMAHAITCGAKVHRVPGSFDNAFQLAKTLSHAPEIMNLTTTFLSPLGVEGYKTIAYEIARQASALPEYLFIPVGAGPIVYGIYKGFAELAGAGAIASIPRLVAVQSDCCAPIVRAWETNTDTVACSVSPGIASAILDPLRGYENNGDLTVQAIRKSGGFAVMVSDQEIFAAGRLLANTEGLFVEPASAAAFAGLCKAKRQNQIRSDDRVAVVLTGSGLKDPGKYIGQGE